MKETRKHFENLVKERYSDLEKQKAAMAAYDKFTAAVEKVDSCIEASARLYWLRRNERTHGNQTDLDVQAKTFPKLKQLVEKTHESYMDLEIKFAMAMLCTCATVFVGFGAHLYGLPAILVIAACAAPAVLAGVCFFKAASAWSLDSATYNEAIAERYKQIYRQANGLGDDVAVEISDYSKLSVGKFYITSKHDLMSCKWLDSHYVCAQL